MTRTGITVALLATTALAALMAVAGAPAKADTGPAASADLAALDIQGQPKLDPGLVPATAATPAWSSLPLFLAQAAPQPPAATSGATNLDTISVEGGTYDGDEAPGVPHTQVSLSGEYDLPFLRDFTVTGRLIYTGRQLYDLAGTQSIPSWTRLDLGARYVFDVDKQKVTARFTVENVAGTNYWASTGDGDLALGTPRTFKFSLAANF